MRVLAGLFDTAFGLPVHPLVVHLPVVLVPLTALGAIVMACWPGFSRRFGSLVVLVGLVALAGSVAAKESGEALARRIGQPLEHAQQGNVLPVLTFLLVAALTGFWLVDRGIPGNRPRPGWVKLAAVVLIVLAVVATVWTVQVGHSGAMLVWTGRVPA